MKTIRIVFILMLFIGVNTQSLYSQKTSWHTDYNAALKTPTKVINLRCNNLDSLPASIGNFYNLEELDLSLSHITVLPKEIGKLTRLKKLKLWHTGLTELPKEIGNLTALTYLDVAENELREIPKEIGKLKALKQLHLESNKLTSIPKEIAGLSNLEYLDVHANQIKRIPGQIGKLDKLTTLILGGESGGNPLIDIPLQLSQLKSIQKLGLAHCNIQHLPIDFFEMETLKYIDLRGNPISYPELLSIQKTMKNTEVVADGK